MPDLEPITRDEMLWSGEDVEPITRREMYIRHLYDETQIIPDKPITREEMFILKAGEELHDVTIEQLNVSENGTYSESGKAYSPVIVNVPAPPLPSNAYLLKEVEGLPKDIATFTDGANLPMPSLKVGIEPVQDLHGYDAPWVGGAGKNKANIADMNVQSQTTMGRLTLPSGTYVASATVKNNTSIGGTIKINTSSENIATGAIPSASGTSRVNTNSFTLSESTEVIIVISGTASGYNYEVSQVQIESGSTATSFAPYSNICPISGWSEMNVSVSGVNVWDEEWELGSITDNGTYQPTQTIRSKNFNSIKPNTNYKIVQKGGGTPMRVCFYDKSKVFINRTTNTVSDFTTPPNCYYFKLTGTVAYGTTYNHDISINYPSTDTEYHAYNGHTYTIDLGGTRYGGEVDVVNGIVTPAPYYASYNGETLTGEWISDRDKYEVGTTPTIGAQVVNIGASGTPVSIQPTAVKSLRGVNNAYANTGDIKDAEYFSKEV